MEQPVWEDERCAGTLIPGTRPAALPRLHVVEETQWGPWRDQHDVGTVTDTRRLMEEEKDNRAFNRQQAETSATSPEAFANRRREALEEMRAERRQDRAKAGIEPLPAFTPWDDRLHRDALESIPFPSAVVAGMGLAMEKMSIALNGTVRAFAVFNAETEQAQLHAEALQRAMADFGRADPLGPDPTPKRVRLSQYLPGTRHAQRPIAGMRRRKGRG